MPSKSQAQGHFFRVVRAMQKGDMPITDSPAGRAAKSMTPHDAHEFAVTKDKGLPEHTEKKSHIGALGFVLSLPLMVKYADVETSIRSAEKAVRQVSEQRRKHYQDQAKQFQQQNDMLQKQLQKAQMEQQKAQMQLAQSSQGVDAATQAMQALHSAPAAQPPYGQMISAMQAQNQETQQ